MDTSSNEKLSLFGVITQTEVVRPVGLVVEDVYELLSWHGWATSRENIPHSCTSKMSHIIQWNCRGLKTNLIELSLLVQTLLLVALCLQETHLKKNDKINLNTYSLYSTYVSEDERAAGGSSIFVKNNIIHSKIN